MKIMTVLTEIGIYYVLKMEEHICDVCGLVCVSKRRLTQHRQTHRDITDKYQCPDCKKLFRTRDKLQRHSSIHSGDLII